MPKILICLIISSLFAPALSWAAETDLPRPGGALLTAGTDTAVLSWQNPDTADFLESVLFRSAIPVGDYFSYEAVANLCDKIYAGPAESYTDTGLAANLPYYYILFARGSLSKADR